MSGQNRPQTLRVVPDQPEPAPSVENLLKAALRRFGMGECERCGTFIELTPGVVLAHDCDWAGIAEREGK